MKNRPDIEKPHIRPKPMQVSVIVPVYKAEKYLEACIESILCQTMPDFELLLVDDGSPDRSGAICDRYAARDGRVRVFHGPNRGVSRARNTGLDQARGEFVVFVDADDTLAPDHLEQFCNSGIGEDGIVFTNLIEERPPHGGRERVRQYPVPDRRITPQQGHAACMVVLAELLRIRCFGWTWNKMFSRATIERLGLRFDETLSYAEDEVFTARYCCHITHLVSHSHPTYRYRFVAGSLLHRPIDPEMLIRTRTLLDGIYATEYYNDEMRYLTCRLFFSRLRRELRRCASSESPQADLLARTMIDNWQRLRRYARPEYRRSFYDRKILLLGWLACGGGKPRRTIRLVRGLHL